MYFSGCYLFADFFSVQRKGLAHFPRKPASDFELYYTDHNAEFFSQNPQLGKEDGRQVLVEKFKNLDAEHKTVYVEKAAKAMEEYQPKLKQFLDQYPDHPKVISYLKKQYGVTVKPMSAGSLYFMEHKDEMFDHGKPVPSKRFHSLDAEQKAVYHEKAAKALEEYNLKLQQLMKDHPGLKIHDMRYKSKLKRRKRNSSSLSAAEKLQSNPTSKVVLAKKGVGVKRHVTEDESGELKQQKNKKMRSVSEKTEKSTELQLAAEEDESDKLKIEKKKKKNKSSASLNHVTEPSCVAVTVEVEVEKEGSKGKSVGLKQKRGRKKRPEVKNI